MDRGVSRGQRGRSPTAVNLSFLDQTCLKQGKMKWDRRLMAVVVNALYYKSEGRLVESRWGELFVSVYLILPAALGHGVYSASNRNEYQKQKAVKQWPAHKSDNLTANCGPIA
jgi:hypothetical protein